MILGSHNSMTYLKPKKWYLYPFQFIARCQSKTISEQYEEYNVRVFDIRISYNKKHEIEFRHGIMAYKGNVYEVLQYLNSRPEPVMVRLVLEILGQDELQEQMFAVDCKSFQSTFQNIKFYGGFRKFDQKIIYDFQLSPIITKIYSSYQLPKLDDLFPYLYAKRHNKKARLLNVECLMIDFIQI